MILFVSILIATVGSCLADQPPLPDIEQICESPREPFQNFEECLQQHLPESIKQAFGQFLEICLEDSSFVNVLNRVCDQIQAGADESEVLAQLMSKCTGPDMPPPPGVSLITKEDEEQAERAIQQCMHFLEPFFLKAMEDAASTK